MNPLSWVGLTFDWYKDAMVFCIFILTFCLKQSVRKDIWMRTTSVTVVVIFWKCHSESYLITTMFKICSQQLWAILTPAFWKTPNSCRFYGHGSTYVLILPWAIIMKQILTNRPGKLHKNPRLHFEENFTDIEDGISLFLYASFSVQQTLFFKSM